MLLLKAKKLNCKLIIVTFLFVACKTQIQLQSTHEDSNKAISNLYRFGSSNGFLGWDANTWEYEDSIYYISTNDDIMKWTVKSGSVKILENVSKIGGFLISENWLYYYVYGKPAIYRLHIDNGLQEIFFSAESVDDFPQVLYDICGFTLYCGKLYIRASTWCFEYDFNSGELYELNDDISSGAFLNNKFYFVEHGQRTFSIYTTDLKNRNTKLVRGDGLSFEFGGSKEIMCDRLAVVENMLYYSERVNAAVFLYADGGDDILIKSFFSEDETVGHLYLETDNQYLYFTHELTNILYRYDPDKEDVMSFSAPEDFKTCSDYCVLYGVLYYRLDGKNIKSYPIDWRNEDKNITSTAPRLPDLLE